ncbi:MAG TPA: amidase, partial [Anaerolineaceae bacterium]
MELCDLSAYEMSRMVHGRQISAREILASCLQRIAQADGRPGVLDAGEITAEDKQRVHAFIHVLTERAQQQAEAVDRSIAAGEDPGALAGVPVAIKDLFCIKDTLTTAASRILSTFQAPYTATPVARMEQAGAVSIGKVNLDEFAYGSSNESSAYQPCPRNPWDLSRVPGG